MYFVLRHIRANLPMRYAFSLVRLAPERTPTESGPCAACRRAISEATRATASP